MSGKKKHLKESEIDEDGPTLGQKYWLNFMKRHPQLKSKNALRFDSLRDDWCTVSNIAQMYDQVCEAMVRSNVAIKLDDAVWLNKENNIVQSKEEAFGRQTQYYITHPDYLVFVDEVGDNTSQRNDGNAGGEKFIVDKDKRAVKKSSYQDSHFTVLGFTLATGEPLCCAIVYSSQVEDVDVAIRMGIQPWCEINGEGVADLEANSNGVEKFFPFGPTCFYKGRKIPCFIGSSENGSITSNLLTSMLAFIDENAKFDRTEATPMLLLDGHGSRFESVFLEYINDARHKWTVCIGVPYGTNVWQVGDSAEQNGAFKIAGKKRKEFVLQEKSRLRLEFKIEKQDIVGIVHYAWNASFARIETNKKAIANRGWYPANYILLDSKELDKNKNNKHVRDAYTACELTGSQPEDLSNLNLATGLSKTLFDQVVEYKAREDARQKAQIEQAEEIRKKHVDAFHSAVRLTAGKAFKANKCVLDEEIRDRVRDINNKKEEKEKNKKKRKEESEAAFKNKVINARAKGGPEKWSVDELKTMVLWYKRPGDDKIPTTKSALYQRYLLTCMRSEEDRSRLKEGETAVNENLDVIGGDAVQLGE